MRRPGGPSGPPGALSRLQPVAPPLEQDPAFDLGDQLIARLRQYATHLSGKRDEVAGTETVFIGQVHSGEIFNQYPQECALEGTRRWLPGEKLSVVEDAERVVRVRTTAYASRSHTYLGVEAKS